MNIFNEPSHEQMDEQISILREIAGKIGVADTIGSWQDVIRILRRKQADKYFSIGDVFRTYYNGEEKLIEIIGINHDVDEGDIGDTLTLQARDIWLSGQFDAPEALCYASSAMPAGKKIFEINSGKYEFTTTKEVPQGGQVLVAGWNDYVPSTATTYAADRVTVIESGIVVTISTGTANLSPVNHQQRCRYGSNNYKESAVRQWLNSDKDTFVWVPKTNYDRPPTNSYPTAGFLKLLDPELASLIKPTEKKVARNNVTDGGGQDTIIDKVFLLSRVEVGLSSEGTTTGEEVYEFWEGKTDADRIKILGVSLRHWWLRSPYVSFAHYVRSLYTSGALSYRNPDFALGLSPAWKIS